MASKIAGSPPTQKSGPCIIYFHEGYSPYLAFSLWQATQSNPEARVILLGDESNRIAGIHYEHYLLSDFSTRLNEFRKIYQHFHPGNLEDERRCIERWLFLAEFVKCQGINNFIFLDSDTLLFENFLVPPKEWAEFDAAGAPLFWGFCFFRKNDLVERFARWIIDQYQNPKIMQEWRARFERYRSGNGDPGLIIQDMALAVLFVKETGARVFDVSMPHGGKVVDTGKWGGAFLQGKKHIDIISQEQKGGKIYARTDKDSVQLQAVHVQGFYKNHIAGLTGWSWPIFRSFFRPNYRKNIKQLFWYGLNGFRYRCYLRRPRTS